MNGHFAVASFFCTALMITALPVLTHAQDKENAPERRVNGIRVCDGDQCGAPGRLSVRGTSVVCEAKDGSSRELTSCSDLIAASHFHFIAEDVYLGNITLAAAKGFRNGVAKWCQDAIRE
jgi:hypothetical protein